uniref:Uncharacterized protein n=1 Tax=viral metagenome TaxID=1070528 RepID=A0A6M3JUY9_9ZZZZ
MVGKGRDKHRGEGWDSQFEGDREYQIMRKCVCYSCGDKFDRMGIVPVGTDQPLDLCMFCQTTDPLRGLRKRESCDGEYKTLTYSENGGRNGNTKVWW